MGNVTLQHMNDDELVERLRGGDSSATDILVTRYRPQLYKLFSKVPHHDAEDLTQEALLALLDRLHGAEPLQGQFRSFAFGVGRRMLLHFCSRRSNGRTFDPEVHTLADLGLSISRQVSKIRHVEWLRGALEQLPIEVVILLELRYVQELPYPEIARIYDLSDGTVKSRVRAAKEKLARMRPAPLLTA